MRRKRDHLFFVVFLLIELGVLPTVAVAMVAGPIFLTGLPQRLPPWGWLVAAPGLYALWLAAYLFVCGLEIRLLPGQKHKPTYMVLQEAGSKPTDFVFVAWYLRGQLVRSLPFAWILTTGEATRWLYFWAFSPSFHIARNVFLGGLIYDPELTEIGAEVILGGGSVICAHAVNVLGPGKAVFVTAPVRIGDRVTVGGEVRIAMGVTIGDDAVVEAGSNVVAMTQIPPAEIWGGNPAVFLRKRSIISAGNAADGPAVASLPAPVAASAPADPVAAPDDARYHAAARQLVERALNMPAGALGPEADAAEGSWDSLGCFTIGAALNDTYRSPLPVQQIVHLRSVADVAAAIRRAETGQPFTPAASAVASPAAAEATLQLPADPEWLPLLPADAATQALNRAARPAAEGEPMCVTIAASFTAQLLQPALECWAGAFGIAAKVEFEGFNQVAQALLDPQSLFHRNVAGVNVVLLRPEDLRGEAAAAEELVSQLLGAMRRFVASGRGAHLVVGSMPPPVSHVGSVPRAQLDALRSRWNTSVAQIEGVEVLEFAAIIEQLGTARAADPAMEAVARAPYSAEAYRELGMALARCLRKRRRPPAKVLALDCDGVLWGGVVGEDGIDGLQLGPDGPGRPFQWFQQAILDLKRRGVLLVLVSRNQERDVLEVFDSHPGMLLRRADLAGWRVNFQPKSQNLRELAAELNLGLDAFVFVDDDPVQRLHVESHLPQVHVFPTPADPLRYAESLAKLWIFDAAGLTAEDASRTEMLQQERLRQQTLDATSSLDDYLAGLQLGVEMREARPRDLPRVAQLTQKTNQFNLSLRRRSLEEIEALARDCRVLVLSALDRFGDYGQVGVCILRRCDAATMEIDTFLLSCRALGRGVEQSMLHGVFEIARHDGARLLRAPVVVGPRNEPARTFFDASTFRRESSDTLVADVDALVTLPKHVTLRLDYAAALESVSEGLRS